MNIVCVACGSARLTNNGQLPKFLNDNLNGELERYVERGCLLQCHECTLQFRFPMPTSQVLNKYYSSVSHELAWDTGDTRPEWKMVKDLLVTIPGNEILDIGCYRGEFLSQFGDEWKKYGIEMSTNASAVASSRGISIIGGSIDNTSLECNRFSIITMIDVIEHLPRPLEDIRILINSLKPGGKLIISTGNTSSQSYRLSGARYYYGAFAEHITFYSPEWFRWLTSKIDCSIESIQTFSHNPATIKRVLDESSKNVLYILFNRMREIDSIEKFLLLIPKIKNISKWENCWWTSAKDHMLVSLVKRSRVQ